ncbi:hypothetical protein VNI00_002493 [Paramarasmius palmivorus]|uniref:RING-type domain-containing protein n=1 Tax=Paramarasmius palmivorus TaxID=297713 RepID=A0AAW0DXM5_9AGAR
MDKDNSPYRSSAVPSLPRSPMRLRSASGSSRQVRLPVVEISSDSDEESSPNKVSNPAGSSASSTNSESGNDEIRRLKEAIASLSLKCVEADRRREEAEKAREESDTMRTAIEQREREKELELTKVKADYAQLASCNLDMSKIETHLTCGICSDFILVPWGLPNCGHVFCAKCLHTWLKTTLEKFRETRPNYCPREFTLHFLTRNERLKILDARMAHQVIAILRPRETVHPEYTCPCCRVPIRARPVVTVNLKGIAAEVAIAKDLPPAAPEEEAQVFWSYFWPSANIGFALRYNLSNPPCHVIRTTDFVANAEGWMLRPGNSEAVDVARTVVVFYRLTKIVVDDSIDFPTLLQCRRHGVEEQALSKPNVE